MNLGEPEGLLLRGRLKLYEYADSYGPSAFDQLK
jgi:hypothetical protein